MKQFHLPTPNTQANQVKAGSVDLGSIKIQSAKMYSARLEMLGNITQIKMNVGKQTLSQPLPHIPQGVKLGQPTQVSVTTNKDGKIVISFFATPSKTSSQTVKVNLNDQQLVNMLSLNKQYKAKPDGSIQTQAQIVLDASKAPALKLQGLSTPLKLPDSLASLIKGNKSIAVTINTKHNKIELQLTQPGKTGVHATFKLPVSSDKISTIVGQAMNKSATNSVSIETKAATPSKITLANQQQITLPTKTPANTQAKVVNLTQRQLTISITTPQASSNTAKSTQKPTANIILQRNTVISALKLPHPDNSRALQLPPSKPNSEIKSAQTSLAHTIKHVSHPAAKVSDEQTAKTSNHQTVTYTQGKSDKHPLQTISSSGAKQVEPIKVATMPVEVLRPTSEQKTSTEDIEQHKQVLNKIIDPLLRVLLPKKLNWSEGLKVLTTLEKQLPQNVIQPDGAQTEDQSEPALKQLLNQLKLSVPDQNTPLTEKRMAEIVSQLLNFSPTKVVTSPRPTPASAIASALQLLLGSKLVQNETKVTPRVIQQMTTLLKPLTSKEGKNAKEMKALTTTMAQTEQSNGSIKALTGLQAGIRHQQLDNVEKKLDGNLQLNLTLPLRIDDEVKELHIAINEEESSSEKDNKKKSIWQLNLTFDLNELGKLMVNAKLKEGEVSMHLYAEQQKTLSLMNKFSAVLEQRLEFHGVKIKNIQSSLGKINDNNTKRQLNSLLQIKV